MSVQQSPLPNVETCRSPSGHTQLMLLFSPPPTHPAIYPLWNGSTPQSHNQSFGLSSAFVAVLQHTIQPTLYLDRLKILHVPSVCICSEVKGCNLAYWLLKARKATMVFLNGHQLFIVLSVHWSCTPYRSLNHVIIATDQCLV